MSAPAKAGLPTARARTERQRRRLRMASMATRSERCRSAEEPATVVLAALAAKVAPVSLHGGWLQAHTGLSTDEVASALAVLEGDGAIAPGSVSAGRGDFLTPAVLELLGIGSLALPWDVAPDVPPSGTFVELTDDELTRAFNEVLA